MIRLIPIVAAVALAAMLSAACGDDDSSKNTPTAGASAVATTAAASPSSAASATATATKPAASATSVASPTAEGTVDPLGAGQQTPWTVKSDPNPMTGVVTVNALRTGIHPEQGGWERIVFEFQGTQRPDALIQYVTKATSCGSGQAVTLPGSAILEVAISDAQAHDNNGKATIPNTIPSAGGTVIAGGASSCDFEGHVTWDFGLNGKHNFKVTTLTNPVRIVIDIKQ